MGKRRDRERHQKWERKQLPRCRHNNAGEDCRQCAQDAREDARSQRPRAAVSAYEAGPVHSQAEVDRWQAMKVAKIGYL